METHPVNILLVDDHAAKLMSYEVILADLDAHLIKATSARQALDLLLKTDVAVILTDVCMPELDGFEFAAMLREHPRFEKTAIIFISAVHMSEHDRARGYEIGAVDYVSVPVVPEILRAKVRVFVDLYRKTRELEDLNRELESRVAERTSELVEAIKRVRESENRLRLASEAAGFGTYEVNQTTETIYCSPELKKLLGTKVEGDLPFDVFLDLVHPEDRDTVRRCMFDPAHSGSKRHEFDFRIRGETSPRWLLDRGASHRKEEKGTSVLLSTGTIIDITSRKQAEEHLRLLTAELDHRVKNTLANVIAMAKLSSRQAPSVSSYVSDLSSRLRAMASIHDLLSRNQWSNADFIQLANEVLAPFRSADELNIRVTGTAALLPPKFAQTIALVLHELATNSVKYGALSRPGGHILIDINVDAEGPRMTWQEKGGPTLERGEPERIGFGLSIITTSLAEFGMSATYKFEPNGFSCELKGGPVLAPHSPTTNGTKRTADTSNPRVLIVEDEALLALDLAAMLASRGFTVVGPAMSIAAASKLIAEEQIDLAILDLNIGGDFTTEIAETLIARGIRVALATGYRGADILPAQIRSVPRISKPYDERAIGLLLEKLAG